MKFAIIIIIIIGAILSWGSIIQLTLCEFYSNIAGNNTGNDIFINSSQSLNFFLFLALMFYFVDNFKVTPFLILTGHVAILLHQK
jgi:hypothetical protein